MNFYKRSRDTRPLFPFAAFHRFRDRDIQLCGACLTGLSPKRRSGQRIGLATTGSPMREGRLTDVRSVGLSQVKQDYEGAKRNPFDHIGSGICRKLMRGPLGRRTTSPLIGKWIKSVGTLRLNTKTKERSPDLIGSVKMHSHLIHVLLDQMWSSAISQHGSI